MKRRTFTFEDAKKFNKLHNEDGMSLRRIAATYETSHRTIVYNLKKYGFPWKTRQYSVDENFFRTLDSLEKLYLLGWIYSDGCVFAYEEKKYYGFSIKIQERDRYILDYFKKLLCSESRINIDFLNDRKYAYLKIGSKKIYDDLLKYGLKPRKTHHLKYPMEIIYDHRPFILGVFDGDGSIHIRKNKMPTLEITGTKEMMMNISDIFKTELKIKSKAIPIKNSYRLTVSGTNPVQKIGKWLYSWNPSVFLKRKADEFQKLYSTPKYGKTFIIYKCPECRRPKKYEKRNSYQLENYTFKSRFCSLSCSGKFYRKFQLNDYILSEDMELALKDNIVGTETRYKLTDSTTGTFINYS